MNFLGESDTGKGLGVIAVRFFCVRGGGTVSVILGLTEMSLVNLPVLPRTVISKSVDTEETDHLLQGFSLRREFFGRAGELFCASGIALRDQANLVDRPVDLAHPCSLLTAPRSHFLHQVRSSLNCRDQFAQQPARAFCDLYVGGG